MTTYKYKGISTQGANVNGVIRAYDEYEAVARLRESCSVITKIEPVQERAEGGDLKKKVKLSAKELSLMASQFSIILTSGMPIVTCVEMVADQAGTKELRAKLKKVAEDVAAGYTLAQSFKSNIPDIPTTFLETVHAGEQSGTLERCFKRLEIYYDKIAKTKGKVAGALIYPAIVIVVAIVVFVIIMTVAIPMFTETFASLGTELPFITKAMMAVSDFFVDDWWILLMIAAALAVFILIFRSTQSGHAWLSSFSLYHSPLKKIHQMNGAQQFSSTMSTMIGAGLSIVQALAITSRVVDNFTFSTDISKLHDEVERGKSLVQVMRTLPSFPQLLTEMTGVGEKSGEMESTLNVVSDYYTEEVNMATARLMAVMEPAITIGLAVVTCVLLLGLYLPMFSMYGSM